MPTRRSGAGRLLPLLTIAWLATCAVAGLTVGMYDIAYTSVNFEVAQSPAIYTER